MRKVLVTGGAGKLGQFVCAELASSCDVTVLDRVRASEDLPSIQADIRDLQAVQRTRRTRSSTPVEMVSPRQIGANPLMVQAKGFAQHRTPI